MSASAPTSLAVRAMLCIEHVRPGQATPAGAGGP